MSKRTRRSGSRSRKGPRFCRNDSENSLYDIVSAELYEKAGRRGDAVMLLEKTVAGRPADGGVITALSRLYARIRQGRGGLEDPIQVEPKDVLVRSALASLYLEQKNYDDAIAEYTRVISERPTDAAALNNLAWLYQQKGDLRRRADWPSKPPPRARRRSTTRSGWILLAQGEPDKAITYLSAASLSAPRNPDIQYHLAVALHRVGRARTPRRCSRPCSAPVSHSLIGPKPKSCCKS